MEQFCNLPGVQEHALAIYMEVRKQFLLYIALVHILPLKLQISNPAF